MAISVTRNPGMLVLAIYLLLVGIGGFVGLGVPVAVIAALALCAGILILVGR